LFAVFRPLLFGDLTVKNCRLSKVKAQFAVPELHDGRLMERNMHVIESLGPHDVIIGRDILKFPKTDLRFSDEIIEWDGAEMPFEDGDAHTKEACDVTDSDLAEDAVHRVKRILDAKCDKADVEKICEEQAEPDAQQREQLLHHCTTETSFMCCGSCACLARLSDCHAHTKSTQCTPHVSHGAHWHMKDDSCVEIRFVASDRLTQRLCPSTVVLTHTLVHCREMMRDVKRSTVRSIAECRHCTGRKPFVDIMMTRLMSKCQLPIVITLIDRFSKLDAFNTD